MKFKNREEKLNWLKSCADKLRQLEYDRRIALLTVYLEQDIDRDTYQQQKTELLLRKKALEEKIDDLEQGICPWRKPLEEWLKQAQDAGKTALSSSLTDKKSLLQKICGVNLSLQNRKVAFTPQKQWAALGAALKKVPETDLCLVLVEMPGVKPGSKACSASDCSQD